MNKKFLRKLKDWRDRIHSRMHAPEVNIRNRMFLVISVLGILVSLACLIETFFVASSWILYVILAVLLAIVISGFITCILGKGTKITSTILAVYLNVVIFPSLFILGGGMNSGAALWFLLGYFYIFLMFSGWKMVLLLIAGTLVDAATYLFAFVHPEYITGASSMHAAYLDSFFGVVAVGITVGILMRVEMRLYSDENALSQKQRDELIKSGQARNRLFAGMSHEIRTPINTIMGLNELTLRSNPSDEVESYAKDIESASNMLLSLVNDILDLSRIEMKQMDIVPLQYNTKDLFLSLYDMIRVHANRKNLELKLEVDPQLPAVLYGDEKRVKQILINLLTNAVKYTEKGSVTLTATGEKSDDGSCNIIVSVTDTGIGIRKEDLEHIYESFRRFQEDRNYSIEGSGLGLSIVKQLVDLMDGTIRVDSIYTRGTVFTVNIPQKVIEHSPVGNISFGAGNTNNTYHYHQKFEAPEARILIVDDNHMNTVVTSRLLAATRMQIYSAKSGKECLEMTRQKYFHAILMDYMMPDMDGRETVSEIRKQENGLCHDTPVIALTATSRSEASDLLEDAEFSAFLEKPIKSELLEEELLNILPRDLIEYRESSIANNATSESPINSVRKRKKVKITTDCACDLPKELLQKYDIGQQYLYIQTPLGRFKDTVEIDSDNMSQYIQANSEKLYAASCSVTEFEIFFAENLLEAVDVIHISLASRSGKTFLVAQEAAEGFDHVHVLDAQTISSGQALLVLEAARLAKSGKSVDEIITLLNEMVLMINCGWWTRNADTLHYFGYARRQTARVLRNLHLHPLLGMRRSRVSIVGFMHGDTDKVWRRFVTQRLRRQGRIDQSICVVTFANCPAHQKEVVLDEILKHVNFDNLIICKSSFSNACSCGAGTFGLAFFEKE